MTLEEALGKITDPEVRKFFETMVANQNSYITKLETQLKEPKAAGNSGAAPVDNITQEYIRKKMREDVIGKATATIIGSFGQEIFNAVKPDFDAFLERNLKPENTTEEYITDAFNLVLGRCYAKKDHPVHQVGKGTNPGATPAPQAGTNGQQVAAVQNVISGQPPVMSGTDASAGQGLPGVQGTPVKNTKDAFARLKDRVANNGGNKFQ
jgi:hypothetical protein